MIDDLGNFTEGPFTGDSVGDVADEDPSYLQHLLDSAPLEKEHRAVIADALGVKEEN
jgi:hypothetical protein